MFTQKPNGITRKVKAVASIADKKALFIETTQFPPNCTTDTAKIIKYLLLHSSVLYSSFQNIKIIVDLIEVLKKERWTLFGLFQKKKATVKLK